MRINKAILILVLVISGFSFAQSFSSDNWEIEAIESRIENYLGKESLYLKGGSAILKDSDFINGIIECKIAFTGERGFMGAIWRVQDQYNYEEFYVRPHQSGNPDANQYTPVFNGLSAWQLYYGEDYAAPIKYKFNEWNQLKIIVSGKSAEIYINDMDNPALFVNNLKRKIEAGQVGVECSKYAPARFTDFKYTSMDNPPMKRKPGQEDMPDKNTVLKWKVSDHFEEGLLADKFWLTNNEKDNLNWTSIACGGPGYVNLARIQGIENGMNTVFARVIIESNEEQVKKVSFGYSDRVKVFFNNKLVYGGQNNYMSRDYRYLGTIGYFDGIYVPLKKGKNEIWFAVSESFGGWGVMARFENMDGISFVN